jgi:hypothetical protein
MNPRIELALERWANEYNKEHDRKQCDGDCIRLLQPHLRELEGMLDDIISTVKNQKRRASEKGKA